MKVIYFPFSLALLLYFTSLKLHGKKRNMDLFEKLYTVLPIFLIIRLRYVNMAPCFNIYGQIANTILSCIELGGWESAQG